MTVANAAQQAQAANESLEIELKYEVPVSGALPGPDAFEVQGLVLGAAEIHQLVARYFDTPANELAGQRVALRVREGGPDEGWHIKVKGEAGTREFHWDLAEAMPAGLVAQLHESYGVAAAALRPIAELRTERRTVRVENGSGVEVVEIADDRVRATQFVYDDVASDQTDGAAHADDTPAAFESRVDRAWREWEAELLPGAAGEWLDRVATALTDAGAVPSLSSAKIARATGALVAFAEATGLTPDVVERLKQMDRNDRAAARRLGS